MPRVPHITTLTCMRCGHSWYPAQPKFPATCAKCRSPYWNKPRLFTKTNAGRNGPLLETAGKKAGR